LPYQPYGTGSASTRFFPGGDACGIGRVTGQGGLAARWAGGLAAGGFALGVVAGGALAVHPAARIAAGAATSRADRFMP
jgi:hypothetical protein